MRRGEEETIIIRENPPMKGREKERVTNERKKKRKKIRDRFRMIMRRKNIKY